MDGRLHLHLLPAPLVHHMLAFSNPMRFPSAEEEDAYVESILKQQLISVQIACFLAGVVMYLFFIWDANVDPSRARETQMLRGLVGTPVIWIATCLCFIPNFRRHVEILSCVTCIFIFGLQVYINSLMKNGMDYGISGVLLIYLFSIVFLRWRFQFYLLFFLASLPIFAAGEIYAGDKANTVMFLPNALTVVSAIAFCMTAAVMREQMQRKTYKSERDLISARDDVNRLLSNFALPGEIERLKRRASGNVATNITISYRRADSEAIAGRIRERLTVHFGVESVYMDIDNIPFGIDFRTHIQGALCRTQLLVVVIGPNWIGRRDGSLPRIFDDTDPIKIEVETALQTRLVVLPVLVGGAIMPTAAELPDTLKDLVYRNAAEVDAGRDFSVHMERLVRSIDNILVAPKGWLPGFEHVMPKAG